MNLNNLIQFCRINNLDDIFAGIDVPAPLNPAAVRSAIMVRCGLLTPVYNDPDLMRQLVTDWFFEKHWTFEHIIKIIRAEYSPIENYDRYEDSTDSRNETSSGNKSATDTRSGSDTHSGTDSTTGGYTDTNSGSDGTENKISAENSSSYQEDNRSDTTYGKVLTNTHNDGTTYGHTITKTDGGTTTVTDARTQTGSNTHSAHLHGNIGVTTNQKMIEEELQLLRHFDAYKWIAEQFENDFMIMIY